ncbi:MAG: hypothetical protein AAGU32_13230 [Bacillota bacterium]
MCKRIVDEAPENEILPDILFQLSDTVVLNKSEAKACISKSA